MDTMKAAMMAPSLAATGPVALAQTLSADAIPVTVDNYNRAQTDVYFDSVVKNGGFGKFRHGRELAPPVQQGIVRPNRDTLYSFAIFDLDAGPVTITLPDGAKRFMGMQVDRAAIRHFLEGGKQLVAGGCNGVVGVWDVSA